MKNNTYKFLIIAVVIIFSYNFNYINISSNKGKQFNININDTSEIIVQQVVDPKTKLPVYYYSNLNIPACNTGECKLIIMTMYWDMYGNYYRYTVPENIPLTKANHKEFNKSDYVRLHKILNDKTSKLKDLEFNKLTEKQADNNYKTDGNTGATIKFIDKTKIKGAVKTTHTLWHVANGKVQKEILSMTNEEINNNPNKIFNSKLSTKEETLTILKTDNELSLIQLQIIINFIEKNKIDLDKQLKNELKNKMIGEDKTLLINDYFLRNEINHTKNRVKNFFEIK